MLSLGWVKRAAPLALALLPLLAAPTPVWADDDEEAPLEDDGGWEDEVVEDDEDDEFDTGWFGVRVGAWYRPSFALDVQVSGTESGLLSGLLGTDLNAERDLGLTENPKSDYLVDFDQSAVLELEAFIETSLVSVYAWWIAPFEYEGDTTVTRDFNFGGTSFSVSERVRSRFRQTFVGFDLELNVLNNRWVRVSPLLSVRAIGIDWEVRDAGGLLTGDTSDIDSPIEYEGYQVLPHPEIGVDFRCGYRDYVDVQLKLAGSYIDYFGIEGTTLRVEAAVTVYPIPFVGIQFGARHMSWHLSSSSDDPDEQFDFDMEFVGATAGLVIRLG